MRLRRVRWILLVGWIIGMVPSALAQQRVEICHGYSCLRQETITYTQGQLGEIRRLLFIAVDASSERDLLSEAIGRLYRWAGEQSDIHNDRAGNLADEGVVGRMDCIDHSTSTTRLLAMLDELDYLRWHRVLTPEVRHFALLFPSHWSAVIEEIPAEPEEAGGVTPGARFVVDSWFVNNGEPAVILPLEEWKKGAGPDV